MKIKIDIEKALKELTLEEKASLCSGLDFWLTKPIERLNIPSMRMSDGPHGLRKEMDNDVNVGMKNSYPATSFPPAVNIASSWDTNIAKEVGTTLAKECKNQGVQIILGPGVNIKRSPLCGRNFEYFSEDPFLSGQLAINYINGCQKEGIGVSLKHFAANSQEARRMTINALVDERALREIYLLAFEMAVKNSDPWTIMCSYNKINNLYSSDNKKLLTDILRTEWKYKGIVVSDWNAVNDRVLGIKAGLDLEMPSSDGHNDARIVDAINRGKLKMQDLDKVVTRILETINKCADIDISKGYQPKEDKQLYEDAHNLARKVARESFVLMKNENKSLPLNKDDEIAIIGGLANKLRYQGAGSSKINPYKVVNVLDAFKKENIKFNYAEGYRMDRDIVDDDLQNKAIELAKNSSKVIFALGLTDAFESEGYDRKNIHLPENQITLLKKIYKVNKNINVILFGGSPVCMKWDIYAQSVLNVYLPGEAGGEAIYDIVFGDYSPSGRLAETYPIKLEDTLSTKYFGMGPNNLEYRESIFVGYRYFLTAKKAVAYPFGYGLSYSTFEYSNLKLSSNKINESDSLIVSFDVKNTGEYDAFDVPQLYVRDLNPVIFKADAELKGFKKVFLKKGQSTTVSLSLNRRSFAYYSTKLSDWTVSTGNYEIMIGSSCTNIALTDTVHIESNNQYYVEKQDKQLLASYYDIKNSLYIPNEAYLHLLGFPLPSNELPARGEFTQNATIGDLQCCLIGKIIVKFAPIAIKKGVPDADFTTLLMIQQGMLEMPLRGLSGITTGLITPKFVDGMLLWANKKRIKGLNKIIGSLPAMLKKVRLAQKGTKKKKK